MNWSETGDGGKSLIDILISELSPWETGAQSCWGTFKIIVYHTSQMTARAAETCKIYSLISVSYWLRITCKVSWLPDTSTCPLWRPNNIVRESCPIEELGASGRKQLMYMGTVAKATITSNLSKRHWNETVAKSAATHNTFYISNSLVSYWCI